MSDCAVIQQRMPQLLVEALDASEREAAHAHIETCEPCRAEWDATRETWNALAALPEVPVPPRVRAGFMAEVERLGARSNVVEFEPRRAWYRVAQAAAVALMVGGSFFAGRLTSVEPSSEVASTPAVVKIGESIALPASDFASALASQANIQNVRFYPDGDGMSIGFEVTSNVTVTGKPGDPALVNLLSYVIENGDHTTEARGDALQWVRDVSERGGSTEPQLVNAVATTLTSDPHEGVRIKAADALKSLPPGGSNNAQAALIEALRNDPNPAVRIKAIEALGNLARSGAALEFDTVEVLRDKAAQADENPYIRVKAAETLSKIDL
jgi:hypothetical protein